MKKLNPRDFSFVFRVIFKQKPVYENLTYQTTNLRSFLALESQTKNEKCVEMTLFCDGSAINALSELRYVYNLVKQVKPIILGILDKLAYKVSSENLSGLNIV